jgi:Two component regulator propeller
LITEDGDLNKSSVWALFLDSKGRFWIGTHKGLWLFDRETNRGKKIHFKVSGLQNLSPLYIRAMAETDDHTLWLGTANYGICKVINEKELQTGYEKKYGMAENSVRSLLASSDGNLYVGYMAGLAVFSPGQDAITHVYTTRDGLCSNFIGCMTEDADGQIWLGSNSGISRYSPSSAFVL